jgi:asparagine synthase (glutamine-hydrolysing)
VGKEVASRRKIGFDNALDLWLRAQYGDWMRSMATTAQSFTRNYLNSEYVMALMEEHAAGKRNHAELLCLLLSLEAWHGAFIRGSEG